MKNNKRIRIEKSSPVVDGKVQIAISGEPYALGKIDAKYADQIIKQCNEPKYEGKLPRTGANQ